MYSPDNRKLHDLYSDANLASPTGQKAQLNSNKLSKTGPEFNRLPPRSPNKYSSKNVPMSAMRGTAGQMGQ